jgi:hypothetical protein
MAATLALDWAVDYPWGRTMDIVEFEPAHAEAFRTLNEAAFAPLIRASGARVD